MDALLHSGPRWSEMPGGVSGVSGLMDELDPLRTHIIYFVRARGMTYLNSLSACAIVAISDEGIFLDTLQIPISLNLC